MSLIKSTLLPLVAVLAAGTFGAVYAEEGAAPAGGDKPKAEKPKLDHVRGLITAVDAAANTIEIKAMGKDGKDGEAVKLTVNAETKITGAEHKKIGLADLKAGDKVGATYNADKVATSISMGGADHKGDKKDGEKKPE